MTKKKPYKTLPENIFWSFHKQLRYTPCVLFMYAVQTPVNIWLSWAAVWLPALVVAEATQRQPLSHAARTVGLLMFGVMLGGLVKKLLFYIIQGKQGFYLYEITRELNHKSLSCFYQNYERKDMRDLFQRAKQATETWNGVQPVQDLPKQAWELLESLLCYCLFGVVISFVSPWLILLLTLAPTLNWFCVRAYQNWDYRNRDKRMDIDSRLGYITNKPRDPALAKDIRIYSMAGWITGLYHSLSAERCSLDRVRTWRHFLSHASELVVILLRDGTAYAILTAMVIRGEITVDKFVLCFSAVSSFAEWVGQILNSWNKLHGLSLALCDLREYLDYPEPEGTISASLADFLTSPPEITFDHVSFRYDGAESDTLHDISFTIHPGEKLALVGLNGAGKTTLVKLLCGLYMPTGGEIYINGVPAASFIRNEYYRLFSPVFQDVRTAFFSLAETVSCRPEKETDFKLAEKCMRLAGLGGKIDSLPFGIRTRLDKQLNKDGTELSGGETNKLMLARALYKDAPVLVLDEPTAALDPIAENEIYLQYNEMSRHKSSLFISHRLASTRFCDRILYLKDGRITEEGTHDSLAAAHGEYSRLYEMQSCWYQ